MTSNNKFPIRVLEVIRQGQIGGGESHILSLVKHFMSKDVHPIIMAFTSGPMIHKLTQAGFQCYVIETNKPFDISVQKRIKQIIIKERIQIIHAHGSRAASNLIWISRILHLPLVYTVHGWSFHQDQKRIIQTLRGWSEKLICSHAREVICVSQSNYQTGQKVFGLNKGCVIENGIDLQRFDKNKKYPNIRKELGFTTEDYIVGFIARCTLQKDPLNYVKAIHIAHHDNPQIKGILVGEGDLQNEVETYIHNNHLEEVIHTFPFSENIPEILSNIDTYCLPSLWEGLSIALLEAMAMAKPLIVTPTDGTHELIHHKENGLIIPFSNPQSTADAILTFFKDRQLAMLCGENAYSLIKERFNAQRVSEQVTDIYKKLI